MKEQNEYVDDSEFYDDLDLLKYDEEDVEYVKEILFHLQWDERRSTKGIKNELSDLT